MSTPNTPDILKKIVAVKHEEVASAQSAVPLFAVRAAAEAGHTVALMSPYDGCERQALCGQIVAEHASTTVDNRGYLLVFNNNLPKQHFRI